MLNNVDFQGHFIDYFDGTCSILTLLVLVFSHLHVCLQNNSHHSMPVNSDNKKLIYVFSVDSSTDDSFVWRGNQGPGSIGDEQDLSDNESQLSGSALVDSCL